MRRLGLPFSYEGSEQLDRNERRRGQLTLSQIRRSKKPFANAEDGR